MNINVFGVHISISRGKSHPQTVFIPDFTQDAKEQALRFVPNGSPKEYFLLARFSYATGAMREFLRNNPNIRFNGEFAQHIDVAAQLGGQLDFWKNEP